MPYIKTIWENGTGEPLNANNLTKMENGIEAGVAHSEQDHAEPNAALLPVSTAQQLALNDKQAKLVSGENLSTINGESILSGKPLVVPRSVTSLATLGYENRGDLRTDPLIPRVEDDTVSVEGIGMLHWVATTLEPDDDETCFSSVTGRGQWLLAVPAYDLLQANAMVEDAVISEWIEDTEIRLTEMGA